MSRDLFMKVIAAVCAVCVHGSVWAVSYKSAETDEYIRKFKATAIEQMHKYKIPASITLAQGILESGSGRSDLAVKANNHFGIKCTSDYKGKTFIKKDNKANDCFRVYANASESYRDHSLFLTGRSHYASLFKLKITDYKGWAKGLKKAGYATNPKYPDLLIAVIEQNKLYELDKVKEGNYGDNEKRDSRRNDDVNPMNDAKPNGVDIRDAENRVEINGVRCVRVNKGDTFFSLSKKYGMSVAQLKALNDFPDNYNLKLGEYIFLKKKRRNYRALDYHVVRSGETMLSISQYYGIQLEQLRKRNDLKGEPRVGAQLKLH